MFDMSASPDPATAAASEARLLVAACEWADLHPPESIHLAATFDAPPGREHEEQIAGDGYPLVAEFSVAELAAALGMSTIAGKRLIGHGLELRHRLPRVWRRVQAGEVPAWRARRVAEATIHAGLTPGAAAYVDRMVAPFVERLGVAAIDRLVARPSPVRPRPLTATRATARPPTTRATSPSTARSRPTTPRSWSGPRSTSPTPATSTTPSPAAPRSCAPWAPPSPWTYAAPARSATSPVTGDGQVHLDRLAELEHGQQQVLLDQVRDWCSATHTRVTIRPVLDLADRLTGAGYSIPPMLREQVVQRDRTCVFPWCSRPARLCQLDHVVPYDPAAPNTSSDNLAALCTFHHRLKTHGAWRYTMTAPGCFTWHSPHRRTYLRDHTGTRHLPRP